jgi:hypothetical protein
VNAYTYEELISGVYEDYHVVIHTQVEYNKQRHPSAVELAYLAKQLHEITLERFPLTAVRKQRLDMFMKNILVVVAHSNDAIVGFWDDYSPDKPILGTMGWSENACFELPDDRFKWFFLVRADHFKKYNPSTIAHEMVHGVSYALYGYADAEHKNRLLWKKLDIDYSLQARALKRYGNRKPIRIQTLQTPLRD